MRLDIRGKSKWKRAAFDLFILVNQGRDDWRVFEGAYAAGLVFDYFNKTSIIAFACIFLSELSDSSYLFKVYSVVRLDVLISFYLGQFAFAVIFLTSLLIDFSFKLIIFLQILYKKNLHFTIFVQGGKAVRILLYSLLKVPILSFGLNCLFSFSLRDQFFEYKIRLLENYLGARVLFIIGSAFYLPSLFTEVVLSNLPSFKKRGFSYTHSLVILKETLMIVLLVICKSNLGTKFFLMFSFNISVYLCYSFYYLLPFFNNTLNLLYIHIWMSASFLSLLCFIADIYRNFMIVEVVFPVMFVVLLPFSKEMLSRRILKITKKKKPSNPYTAELKIRSMLLNDPETSQEVISSHFKASTKDFFSFKLQYIWEAIIYFSHLKNKKLALMKLVKVNLSEYKSLSENTTSNIEKNISYPISLEIEFLHYALFSMFIKKVPDMGYDILLLSFSKNYKIFLEFEQRLLRKLLTCTHSFASEKSSKIFNKKLNKLGDLIRKYFFLAKKMMEKFGDEKEFLKIFESFVKKF